MSDESNEAHYDVLWPLADRAATEHHAAPRLRDLNGKTIAEVWDAKFHGEIIYPLIREHLRSRFPDVRFVEYSEFGNFYGPDERRMLAALPEKLRALGCDAVISGIGA